MDDKTRTITFKIEGMTCSSCAFHARQALEAIAGVRAARIDSWHKGNAEIETTSDDVIHEQIREALSEVGYIAVL